MGESPWLSLVEMRRIPSEAVVPNDSFDGSLQEKFNKQTQLEREVQRLIATKGDYKAYYYIPKDGHMMRGYRKAMEIRSEKGGMASSEI